MSNNKFDIEKKEFYTLITLKTDKLDAVLAPILKSELVLVASNGEKNIIMDLGEVRYCDSSGLSTILVANRLCKNASGTLVICKLQNTVLRLISISQLDSVLNIADSIEEAEKIISRNSSSA